MKQYDVREYVAPDGKKPYGTWLKGVKDSRAKAKLLARADKAAYGNFGDWKAIKEVKDLFEMREHYGPGYRIHYAIIHGEIVVLLAGSVKADQNKDDRHRSRATGGLREKEVRQCPFNQAPHSMRPDAIF